MTKIRKPWLTREDLDLFLGGGVLDVLPHAVSHEKGGTDLIDTLAELTVDKLTDIGTGATNIAAGTTGQRPGGIVGDIRYNSTLGIFEIYTGAWVNIITSATGVVAGAVLADHTLIRGDGGARGIQDSSILIDDADNVSGMGTLGCGTITVANGSSINLQEDITFTGATTENQIKIPDNLADAFSFKEGANFYQTFITTDGSEAVRFYTNVGIGIVPTEKLHIHVYDGDDVKGLRITQQDTGEKALDIDTIDYGLFIMGRDADVSKYLLKLQGNTGAIEALYVGSNGNVGIGTATPASTLDIYSATSASVNIEGNAGHSILNLDAGGVGNDCRITFQDDSVVKWLLISESTSDDMTFYSYTLAADVLTLKNTGNVGIGNAGPDTISAGLTIGTPISLPAARLNVRDGSGGRYIATFEQDSATGWGLYIDTDSIDIGDPVLRIHNASANILTLMSNGMMGLYHTDPRCRLQIGADTPIVPSVDGFQLRVDTAGAYAMVIENDQVTGWGLHIDTDSTVAGDPVLTCKSAVGDILNVIANGRVGIGTASPEEQLNLEAGPLQIGMQADGMWTSLSANDFLFNRAGVSYIKQQVVGGSIRFVVSEAAPNDVNAMTLRDDGKIGMGGETNPDEALQVTGIVKADTFHLQAGVTPNIAWLSDVVLGTLEEGETIRYDQATAKFIDSWGIDYDNPRLVWKMYTDFFSAGVDSNDPWIGAAFGAGGKTALAGTSNHPGIIRLSSGDVGGYRFMTATNCILIAGAEHSEFCFKTGAIIAGAYIRLGFQDSNTATAPTDGAWIDISGATLTGKTKNNGAGSTTGTNYALAASTWYRGKIAVLANQLLTIAVGGYVNCVAGDVGKQVQVDGEEFGLLDSYDNPTRVWRVSTGRLIPAGSAITITAGTGAGTSTVNSVTTVKEVLFALYTLVAGEQTIVWTDSLTTNIPIATGRETGHGVVMYVATSVARYFDLDMMIATRAGYITR